MPDTTLVHVTGTTWRHLEGDQQNDLPDSTIIHVPGTTWRHFSGGADGEVPDTTFHHIPGTSSVHFMGGEPQDVPEPVVPTVSEWGLAIMTLLGLTAGTIIYGRRRLIDT